MKCYTGPQNWTNSLEWPRQWKMDMRFGTMNVRSLYRTGSLKTVASEFAKYKLDLVTVWDVGWDEDCSQPADCYTFFYGSGNVNYHLGAGFFIRKGVTSAV
jgi:hypothetical protein